VKLLCVLFLTLPFPLSWFSSFFFFFFLNLCIYQEILIKTHQPIFIGGGAEEVPFEQEIISPFPDFFGSYELGELYLPLQTDFPFTNIP